MHKALQVFPALHTAANLCGADILQPLLAMKQAGNKAWVVLPIPLGHLHFVLVIRVVAPALANGVCSILQKMHGTRFPEGHSDEFMLFAMLICSVIFCAVALYRQRPTQIQNEPKLWLGVLSGVTNGLAGFFTLILAGPENATVLFPVISAGTLLGALLCGRFVFKEKLRYHHYASLLFGMLAVVLLKL